MNLHEFNLKGTSKHRRALCLVTSLIGKNRFLMVIIPHYDQIMGIISL